jgi:hypothetical protein
MTAAHPDYARLQALWPIPLHTSPEPEPEQRQAS